MREMEKEKETRVVLYTPQTQSQDSSSLATSPPVTPE